MRFEIQNHLQGLELSAILSPDKRTLIRRFAELRGCELHSQLKSFKATARWNLPRALHKIRAPLFSKECDGVDSHAPSRAGDQDAPFRAIFLGLDFGTSSLKVVLFDPDEDLIAPVPMTCSSGITAYLLETGVCQKPDGHYVLLQDGEQTDLWYQNLKMDVLADSPDPQAIRRAIAFLALAIRQTRAWANQHLHLEGYQVFWDCRMGYPSSPNHRTMQTQWQAILRTAWLVSNEAAVVDDALIERVEVQQADTLADDSDGDYSLAVVSEVEAAAAGFWECHPREDSDQLYTLIDIGACTVDVSAFAMCKNVRDGKAHFTPFARLVLPIGSSMWHRSRILGWLNAVRRCLEAKYVHKRASEVLEPLQATLESELNRVLTRALPPSADIYVDGASLRPPQPNQSVDFLYRELFFQTVFAVRRLAKDKIGPQDIPKMHIILSGGGARCSEYTRCLSELSKERLNNYEWARLPAPLRMGKIREINYWAIPVSESDQDRLLVAYGLCRCEVEEHNNEAASIKFVAPRRQEVEAISKDVM